MTLIPRYESGRGTPTPKRLDAASLKDLSQEDFGTSLRAAARGLWRGEITQTEFTNVMLIILGRHYENAWREGAAEMGILPEERTVQEQQEILNMLVMSTGRLGQLAEFIIINSRATGTKWGVILSRLSVWETRYTELKNMAMTMSGENQKLVWEYGDTIEHCGSCGKLRGKSLACKGYNCDCRLSPTNAPATPGPLPQIP
jgi:hypothetical protein